MHVLDDTIAAIVTAPGAAGLAVVRVSGGLAMAISDRVFRGRNRLEEATSHTVHHGWAAWPAGASAEIHAAAAAIGRGDPEGARHAAEAGGAHAAGGKDAAEDPPGGRPGRLIDEVVAAVFRAPRSYTRDDVVEFSCHGGRLSADRVLAALLRAGARLARPGEFTLRAFLNGRIDLVQAEAVADLIQAETESARELALSQLAGRLSQRLGELSERIADSLAEVEARVDFAEDVGGVEVPEHVVAAIDGADAELAALLSGAAYARAVREGVRLPLVGRPNVGKSSLFNALVGEERAIVTARPGTTRDRVSEAVEIAGIRVTLSDTAGLRTAREEVEAIGVALTHRALEETSVVIWVVDGSVTLAGEDREIARRLAGKRVLVALNKRDRGERVRAPEVERLLDGVDRMRVVAVSALRGDGIEELRSAVAELLSGDRDGEAWRAAVSNRRHVEALARAREALGRAAEAGRAGSPGEIVALELHESLSAIGEVTGRNIGDDVLERIFSRFCIGK